MAMPRATGRPWMEKVMVPPLRRLYSPSPNFSLMSATNASSASCSCSPSVSIITSLPMPAASIITPMMLLALTRRSPLAIHTSQGKLAASLVSLAEARACRPSLLLMVVVVLIMGTAGLVLRRGDGHLHHPLRAADDRARHQR